MNLGKSSRAMWLLGFFALLSFLHFSHCKRVLGSWTAFPQNSASAEFSSKLFMSMLLIRLATCRVSFGVRRPPPATEVALGVGEAPGGPLTRTLVSPFPGEAKAERAPEGRPRLPTIDAIFMDWLKLFKA